MATDYQQIVRNLLAFYDFRSRRIVSVGAGGGQFIEYGRTAGHVTAVDCAAAAIRTLEMRLKDAGLEDKFTLKVCDFMDFVGAADCVLFEFSLHEITLPEAALEHALTLASDVVVMDHGRNSPWAYYVAEEEKVRAAWTAVDRYPKAKERVVEAFHVFHDYPELHEKVKGQGEPALSRIEVFRGRTDFKITMSYALAHIARGQ